MKTFKFRTFSNAIASYEKKKKKLDAKYWNWKNYLDILYLF